MNYSFEYIDIILLAMIAGFIFLRLRGILGKRTGFDGKPAPQFEEMIKNIDPNKNIKKNENSYYRWLWFCRNKPCSVSSL